MKIINCLIIKFNLGFTKYSISDLKTGPAHLKNRSNFSDFAPLASLAYLKSLFDASLKSSAVLVEYFSS